MKDLMNGAPGEFSRSYGVLMTMLFTGIPLLAWLVLLITAIPATISAILILNNPERPIKRETMARMAIILPAFTTIVLLFRSSLALTAILPVLVLLYVLAVACLVGSVLSNLRAAKLYKDAYAVAAKRV